MQRAGWVVADQALSSLTNFGLSVLVLRKLEPAEFGAFSVTLLCYYLALNLCRAVAGEPHVVRYSHVAKEESDIATSSSTGLALVLGLLGGAILYGVSFLIPSHVGDALRTLAPVLPGLLLQDSWRYCFFSAGKPAKAFVNDLIWAISQVAFVGWVLVAGLGTVEAFVLAWGTAASLAAVIGALQAGQFPVPRRAWWWLSAHRDLGPRFAAEFAVGVGYSQVMFFLIGGIAGLSALGAINAARVLLGPYNVIALGAVGFGVPEGSRVWRGRPRRLAPVIRIWAAILASLALACGVATLVLPASVGRQLLGATWPNARKVLPFTVVFVAAAGAMAGAQIGLRVLAASKASLRARVYVAPLMLGASTFGAWRGGAPGAAAGMAMANCIGAIFYLRAFESANRSMLLLAVPAEHATVVPID
jgi:O-antigen/teichoic acid export membrane protein